MSKCPACLGREFSFEQGPCPLCNRVILGFAISIKEAPDDRHIYESPEMERDALLRGIADAIAETMQDVAQEVKKPY